jgi:hypothetical protein
MLDGREDRTGHLPSRSLSAVGIEIDPHPAAKERAIRKEREMPRCVEEIADPQGRRVGPHGLRSRGKRQGERPEHVGGSHGDDLGEGDPGPEP